MSLFSKPPRPWLLASSVVAAVALGLMACSDSSPTDPPGGSGNGQVEGVVARHKTGEGVPGLVVAALFQDRVVATTQTDDQGNWGLSGLANGPYRIAVTGTELAGLDIRYDAMEPGEFDVDVVAGAPESLVFAVVGLIPTRISGAVTCGGAPVAGAQVRIIGGSSDVTATTTALGRFAALDLYPGSYAVFPIDVPCLVAPGFHAMSLRQGEFGEADFEG